MPLAVGDAGYVLVKPSNGDWAFVGAFSGSNLSWHQEAISLTAFVGQSVVVAFLFTSDASGTADGWYIDDVSVGP
jgi:bacillopeptidase F (M6 metalloprotease family)